MGTKLPKNIEVHAAEPAPDGDTYRSADGGQRRVVRIRGTNTTRNTVVVATLGISMLLCAAISASSEPWRPLGIIALVLFFMSAHVGSMLLYRWLRRVRLELSRRELVVVTRPIGRTVRVGAWSASRPFVVERHTTWSPLASFAWWDLHVENESGGRTKLATLTDETSADAIVELLRDGYRDAPPPSTRSEVAARFGPPPSSIAVRGDVTQPGEARWTLTVAHTRSGQLGALARVLFLGTITVAFALGTISATLDGGASGLLAGLLVLVPVTLGAANALRDLVMRTIGRAELSLSPSELVARTWPLPTEIVAPRGRTIVAPRGVRTIADARLGPMIFVEGANDRRIVLRGFPLDADEATYLARVMDTYCQARER
ncbi:MAG: hypothetical protein K1X94_15455 [Sandaracinaceae bacterium]|nr:hypothetical protein [Sandaracinaceae bacterium]